MTLERFAYVAMLVFVLIGTLPLVPAFGLAVFRRPARLALTIGLAATPFVIWDLWATASGHWAFDEAQTLPIRIAGLPVEELGFFVVIPLAAILTYEAVRVVKGDVARRSHREREDAR